MVPASVPVIIGIDPPSSSQVHRVSFDMHRLARSGAGSAIKHQRATTQDRKGAEGVDATSGLTQCLARLIEHQYTLVTD